MPPKKLEIAATDLANGLDLTSNFEYRLEVTASAVEARFELLLTDDRGDPLAGVPMQFDIGGSPVGQTTGKDGRAVARGAAGPATARIADTGVLARILANRFGAESSTSPPALGEDTHVRLASDAARPVSLPAGQPQTLVVVSRLKITHASRFQHWDGLHLAEDGPWSLEQGEQICLRLCADGTGRNVSVLSTTGEASSVAGFADDQRQRDTGQTSPWLETSPDDLYCALQDNDEDALLQLLRSIPVNPPAPEVGPPGGQADKTGHTEDELKDRGEVFPESRDFPSSHGLGE